MRVGVTGASGFIGRALVEELRGRGDEPVVLPRGAPPEADVVVHLAFVPGDLDANRRLQAALFDSGIPVVVAGSAAEYGAAQAEDGLLSEDVDLAPLSEYGRIKARLEAEALAAGGDVTWLRIFNVIGPGQPAGHPVADWALRVAALERDGGGTLQTGDLRPERDFLDVCDVATALHAACGLRGTTVANVASGNGVRLRRVATMLIEMATTRIALGPEETGPPPAVPRAVGDPARFRELTGWLPAIGLDQSLRDVLDEARRGV